MNKASQRQSKHRAGAYKLQRARTAVNKLAACKRHVEKHPDDSFGKAQLLRRMKGEI